MKALFFFGLLLAATAVTQAADTAYSALRVIGKREGQETLNRVMEVRARGGAPHPSVWKVIIDEPRARGGVREIEVQRGKIIGERTPNSTAARGPMNFNQLNLDSDGAFTVADKEAQKAGIPFDRVDYVLKSGTNGGAPVWELELYDGPNGRMGSVSIAADTGSVLRRQLDRSPRAPVSNDRDYLDDRGEPAQRPPSDDRTAERNSSATLPAFLDRVGRHFQKRGRQLENFFTGK